MTEFIFVLLHRENLRLPNLMRSSVFRTAERSYYPQKRTCAAFAMSALGQ